MSSNLPTASHHPHHHTQPDLAKIRLAFLLNLGFTLVEVAGGLLTNSLAILADSIHDLGDSISLGLAFYLERHAHKENDARYSYGYRRFSLLGAMINTIVLIAGGLYVLSEAIPRLFNPQHSNAPGMVLLAIIGITVNGAAVLRLKGGHSLNTQLITWHLLEDVLGWTAVLLVSISLLFMDIHILDPILSILISLYVLFNVLRGLRRTLALFLQAVPEAIPLPEIEHALQSIPAVKSIHHTHIWSLDGQHNVLTTHLVVESGANKDDLVRIKRNALEKIKGLALEHTTIELEYEDEDCSMR